MGATDGRNKWRFDNPVDVTEARMTFGWRSRIEDSIGGDRQAGRRGKERPLIHVSQLGPNAYAASVNLVCFLHVL